MLFPNFCFANIDLCKCLSYSIQEERVDAKQVEVSSVSLGDG